VDDDVAYRLLRLEQRLASYEQLYAQELGEMRQELDGLKRQVVLHTLRQSKAQTIRVDVAACNGCGQCVSACVHRLFELAALDGRQIARAKSPKESELSKACAECQAGTPLCVTVCAPGAITLR